MSTKWKKIYNNFNKSSSLKIKQILSPLSINNTLFGSKKYDLKWSITYKDITYELESIYKISKSKMIKYNNIRNIFDSNFDTINKNGYINPFDQVVLDVLFKLN